MREDDENSVDINWVFDGNEGSRGGTWKIKENTFAGWQNKGDYRTTLLILYWFVKIFS